MSLDDYWSEATREFEPILSPGRHRASAVFVGNGAAFTNLDMRGMALMNFWQGQAASGEVESRCAELARG